MSLAWLRLILIIIIAVLIFLGCSLVYDEFARLDWVAIVGTRQIALVAVMQGLILGGISLVLIRDRHVTPYGQTAAASVTTKYQAIVEDQAELICRYRQDATIAYVNDVFCDYFGIDKKQLIDREYTPVVYEADRERVAQLIATMNPDNPIITIEHRVIARGKLRWTQWNNRMIFDDGGNFLEYQAVGRDITALKEIELKLRESEEKFRRAFEDAATGEALVALDGTFIQVNRSFCELLGYSETELLKRKFQDITHAQDLNLDLSYVRQMLAGEIRTYQMEKRYFHQQGYVVWVLLNVSLVRDLDGKPIYFISQIQDLDRRKYTEARLNALVKELERSNQELEDFASVVSHDLISPLRKQQMLIELIDDRYAGSWDSEIQDYLVKVGQYNARMKNLVDRLLAYARVTTKAQPFTAVDLNQLLQSVLYDLESEIAQNQALVTVEPLPTIKGDRFQLEQLWLNLLQNALKFHSGDRIPEINITCECSKDRYQIIISDNGIGFEPEQQSKIFTPFHRLHSQRQYAGTGLGLTICYKIVQRHQGTITATSQPNKGAVFTISLPVSVPR